MADGIEVITEVGSFVKNSQTTVRARLTRVRGKRCLDLRCFYVSGANGTATRQGICMTADKAPDLLALVKDLAAVCASDVGVDDPDSEEVGT